MSLLIDHTIDDISSAGGLTTIDGASPNNINVGTGFQCAYKNLEILRTTTNTVDVDADTVVLALASGIALKRFDTLNVTLDITASGESGLDTGSATASTWYHIWGIGRTDGTLNGILSLSTTAPTLPTGYEYQGYLGAIYLDASSNLVEMEILGSVASIVPNNVVGSAGPASYTPIGLTTAVPTTARAVLLNVNAFNLTTNTSQVFLSQSNSAGDLGVRRVANPVAAISIGHVAPVRVPISTSQTIYYRVAGISSPRASIDAIGWEF